MPDVKNKGKVRSMICTIATATVIEIGDLVAISAGLIIKATATSTKVAMALQASASGDVKIEVTRGRAEILMDSSDAFAVTHKGGEYDIAVSGSTGKQTVNQSGTSYKVIMIDPSQDAGIVDATTNIKCIINRPIDEMLGTV